MVVKPGLALAVAEAFGGTIIRLGRPLLSLQGAAGRHGPAEATAEETRVAPHASTASCRRQTVTLLVVAAWDGRSSSRGSMAGKTFTDCRWWDRPVRQSSAGQACSRPTWRSRRHPQLLREPAYLCQSALGARSTPGWPAVGPGGCGPIAGNGYPARPPVPTDPAARPGSRSPTGSGSAPVTGPLVSRCRERFCWHRPERGPVCCVVMIVLAG